MFCVVVSSALVLVYLLTFLLIDFVLGYFIDNEDLLGRTTLVGIVLAFRKLTLDALHNVSCYRLHTTLQLLAIVLRDKSILQLTSVCTIREFECNV